MRFMSTRRYVWILRISFVVIGAYLSFLVYRHFDEAPESGWEDRRMSDILSRVSRGPSPLYCFSSPWEQNRVAETGRVHRVDSNQCEIDLETAKWSVFDDVVNGQFRCEAGGVVAEFSIQAFRKRDTVYGRYFCTTGQFPSSEHHDFGTVTEVMTTPY